MIEAWGVIGDFVADHVPCVGDVISYGNPLPDSRFKVIDREFKLHLGNGEETATVFCVDLHVEGLGKGFESAVSS